MREPTDKQIDALRLIEGTATAEKNIHPGTLRALQKRKFVERDPFGGHLRVTARGRDILDPRVQVLCGCGWGDLNIRMSDVPRFCPLCGNPLAQDMDEED